MADIVYTSTALPDAVQGLAYQVGISYKGAASAVTAQSVATGALPAGLALDTFASAPGSLRIAGTPTVSGTFTFTLSVTDTAGAVSSGTLTLVVHPEGTIFSDVAQDMPTDDNVTALVNREWLDMGTV